MSIDYREGQAYASEVIQSAATTPKCFFDTRGPLDTVLSNLEATAQKRPQRFADGILDVVRKCRELAE